MANDLTVHALALDRFRRQFGVAARPEDHPKLWEGMLATAADDLNDAWDLATRVRDDMDDDGYFDEGGEG